MSATAFSEHLARRAHASDLALDQSLNSAFEVYFDLLRRWNRRINLTGLNLDSLTDEGVDRLFIEPLIAARYVLPGAASIIDLGSGGGSPAIPLALAVRGATLTMVESRTKKSVFLREVAREVGLQATVLTARFEALTERAELNGAFDTLTCRALRLDAADLVDVGVFIRSGGRILLFRSVTEQVMPTASPLSRVTVAPLPRAENHLEILLKA